MSRIQQASITTTWLFALLTHLILRRLKITAFLDSSLHITKQHVEFDIWQVPETFRAAKITFIGNKSATPHTLLYFVTVISTSKRDKLNKPKVKAIYFIQNIDCNWSMAAILVRMRAERLSFPLISASSAGKGLVTLWFTTRQFIYSPPLVAV